MQVAETASFLLQHVRVVCVSSGNVRRGRLLAAVGMPAVGMPQSTILTSARCWSQSERGIRARVALGHTFHDHLDFWRRFVATGLDSREWRFFPPQCTIIIIVRPPHLTAFSDASKRAVGGYCAETG